MPNRRTSRRGGSPLAVMVVCACLTGCGNDREPDANRRGDRRVEVEQVAKGRDAEGTQPAADPYGKARRLTTGRCTLTGNFREFNDDAVAVEEFSGSTLGLAADGMGGASGKAACDRTLEVLKRELKNGLRHAGTPDQNRAVVRGALVAANEDLIAAASRDPALRNVGTTVVLALWRQENGIYVAGVGDSRAYLVRGDTIEQLTVDQTLAQALVEAKTITAEEARTHRFRTVLWKYLGTPEVGNSPEVRWVPVRPRDRVLLCTDGLHGVVPDDRIVGCMRQHADVQKCAEALCRLALDSGSRNNVSCVVLAVPGDE